MPSGIVLRKDLFQRGHDLTGTVAGRGVDGNLRGFVFIEASGEFGSGGARDFHQGTERNAVAVGAGDVEAADVIGVGAVLAFGFDVGLPLAAKAIEIVHEVTAHESLHRGVDVALTDLLLGDFFAIDLRKKLRHRGKVSGDGDGYFGTLRKSAEKLTQVGGEELLIVLARPIFQNEADAA